MSTEVIYNILLLSLKLKTSFAQNWIVTWLKQLIFKENYDKGMYAKDKLCVLHKLDITIL